MPGGHNGAFERGSWKGVLAGRLEVEHCSWGEPNSFPGARLHWMPVSKTKLLFLRARGGGLPQSWTEGKAISYPLLLHPPQVKETWCVEAFLLWMQINRLCCLSGELKPTWGGWDFQRGQTFLQIEQG